MKLLSNTFQHQEYIPERCAFGIKDTENHMALGENNCLLYTSPSPRDTERSRMPSSA